MNVFCLAFAFPPLEFAEANLRPLSAQSVFYDAPLCPCPHYCNSVNWTAMSWNNRRNESLDSHVEGLVSRDTMSVTQCSSSLSHWEIFNCMSNNQSKKKWYEPHSNKCSFQSRFNQPWFFYIINARWCGPDPFFPTFFHLWLHLHWQIHKMLISLPHFCLLHHSRCWEALTHCFEQKSKPKY